MISKQYKEMLTDIHARGPFGKRAKIPTFLAKFIDDTGAQSIVDFGCGKGHLVEKLREDYPDKKIYGYDPANPEYDIHIPKVDLLISTDVLEHVEPNLINQTLEELQSRSQYIYHLISCAPAKLVLPDGRNAHLIQESAKWWRDKFTNLSYNIIREDYREFTKFSKQLRKELPVKNYYIMAENTKWEH